MRRLAPLGALLLTLARPTLADDAERVLLLMPGCELPFVNAGELRQAVALDLQSEGLALTPVGEFSPGRDLLVIVETNCLAPDELTLRAERGAFRQSRTFHLSELTVEQRARALSLALAELATLVLHPPPPGAPTPSPADPEPVESTKSESTAAAKPPALPAVAAAPRTPSDTSSPVSTRAAKKHAPPDDRGVRLGVAPELRFFADTTLWGMSARLQRAQWRYGAGLLMAPEQAPIGTVWTRLVQANAAYAFPLLGEVRSLLVESGPRVGLGYAIMSVRPAAGARGYGARDWYADVAWTLRFTQGFSRAFQLGLGAELGYARGPIGYADNFVIAQTSGPFASLSLEVSLRL